MVDVRLLEEQSDRLNDIVGIVNPSSQDFTCTHDSNANKHPITYTIKSREGLRIKRYIADHIAHKLATQMLSDYKGPVTQQKFDEVLNTIKLYD